MGRTDVGQDAVERRARVDGGAVDRRLGSAVGSERLQEYEVAIAGDGVDVTMVGRREIRPERVREYGDTGAEPLLRTLTEDDGPANPLDAVTPH